MTGPKRRPQGGERRTAPSSGGVWLGIDRRAWWAAAALIVVTIVAYARVSGSHFITNYDDSIYVTDNPHVTTGLTPANIAWAFTHQCAGNWHPLTMLSHMLDCQLFGLAPGPPHVENLLWHLLNTLFLFYLLALMTGRAWPSLCVAGLFALHPLHVESVAWVAERKDVLSAFFWFLTIWAYLRYLRTRTPAAYGLLLGAFALGLMAKPMLVTLPFVLILLDVWPLQRLRLFAPGAALKGQKAISLSASLREKVPLLLMVLVSIVLTLHAQGQVGALSDTVKVPIGLRLSNSLTAYVAYLVKFFVPRGLAVLYPYPTRIPAGEAAAAALLLIGISALLYLARKRAPFALAGWLWFAGTLVPVIGLVQVGSQSMADRYTYLPHIGLYIAVVWAGAAAVARLRLGWGQVAAVVTLIFVLLAAATWRQVGYWQDARHLFGRALEVTTGNFIAQSNFGVDALGAGDLDGAVQSFQKAVEMNPSYATAVYNLGVAYRKKGMYPQSAETLQKALALAPNDPKAELNLAMVLAVQQKFTESIPHYEAAMRLAPGEEEAKVSYSNALNNYAAYLGSAGRQAEAIEYFQRALEVNGSNKDARQNLDRARAASRLPGGTVK